MIGRFYSCLYWLSACALFHFAEPSQAAVYNLTPAPFAEALRGSTVTSISRDGRELLWLTTFDEAWLFDGNQLRKISITPTLRRGLPSAKIQSILHSDTGGSFLTTFRDGIYFLDRTSSTFVRLAEQGFPNGELRLSMAEMLGPNDIVVTTGSLARHLRIVDRRNVQFKHEIDLEDHIVDLSPHAGALLALLADGRVAELQLSSMNGELESIYRSDISCIVEQTFTSFALDPNSQNALFVTDKNQFFEKDNPQTECHRLAINDTTREDGAPSIGSSVVRSLGYGNDRLFIATDLALLSWHRGEGLDTVRPSFDAPRSLDLTSMHLDSNSSGVIGTFSGLYLLERSRISDFSHIFDETNPAVVDVASGSDQTLVASTSQILEIENTEGRLRARSVYIRPPRTGAISAIAKLGNSVVIGRRNGIIDVVPLTNIGSPKGPKRVVDLSFPITSVSAAGGDSILASTAGSGVVLVHDVTSETPRVKQTQEAADLIIDLASISTGSVIAVGEENTWFLENEVGKDTGNSTDLTLIDQVPYFWAMSSHGDSCWFASPRDDLFMLSSPCFQIQHFKSPRVIRALAGSNIFSLEATRSAGIWVSTNKGLYEVTRDASGKFIATKEYTGSLQFDYGVSGRLGRTTLFFGGVGGLVAVDSGATPENPIKPSLRVTELIAAGRELGNLFTLTEVRSISMPAHSADLSLTVAPVELESSSRLEIAYKLTGFSDEWSKFTPQRTVTFRGLSPGRYSLEVVARNTLNQMSESPFALDISVAPPWWKTWIAYAAYVAAALCLAAMARSRYEDRVIRRRSEALAAEREIQAEEVADELEERMDLQTSLLRNVSTRNVATLHFIRDIIRNHSDTLPDSLSAQLAQETSGRVEALALLEDNLKYAEDLLLIDLYRYTSRCFEFLESRYRTAERGVAVIPVNDVARTLVPADHARRFALLIYELADNTFQHAFADTPHGGILHIRMTIRIDPRDGKARVEMVAQDSGSGIPEGMTIDDAESGGFTLIRNILTHYGGSASISVEPGRGSTVEIVLEVPDFIPEASIGASALEGYDD